MIEVNFGTRGEEKVKVGYVSARAQLLKSICSLGKYGGCVLKLLGGASGLVSAGDMARVVGAAQTCTGLRTRRILRRNGRGEASGPSR